MKSLAAILGALAMFVLGWRACYWYNDLSVSQSKSAESAQVAVDGAVVKAGAIQAEAVKAEDSRIKTRTIIKEVYVDKDCPAGVGAVSDDLAERLRVKFAAAGKGAASR